MGNGQRGVTSTNDSDVSIDELLAQFYTQPDGFSQLGRFEAVPSVPPPYDRLLDHHKHMTVTVESHYGEKVDVQVLRCQQRGDWYAREITLSTTRSRRVVQYGSSCWISTPSATTCGSGSRARKSPWDAC
jgi:hypothetical protein